jgi:UDP-glucose 4-epimerase
VSSRTRRDTYARAQRVIGAALNGQHPWMRVVVTGATGNVGTAVVRALRDEPAVEEIVAVARRVPARPLGERVRFVAADVFSDDLEPVFRGADVVVHLAWLIQPGRDEGLTSRVNVEGSRRVFRAVVATDVEALVYASSVGVYSPGPKDRRVDESWPTDGIASSFYSRQKAEVERALDLLTIERPGLRIVRLRPGLIFQRSAATEIRRLFAGPLLPGALLRSGLAPVSPAVPGLRFQAVHSDDVGDAYRRAVISEASGSFNIAAEPVIGSDELAGLLRARAVLVPAGALRGAAAAAYTLRLTPVEPGWLDLALGVPLMSLERARSELGWTASRSATEALGELMAGMRDGADGPTPPLSRATSGPLRVREFLTGMGQRP